jgi:hypothetical protein
MGQSQKLATVLVRCCGFFMLVLGCTSLVARLGGAMASAVEMSPAYRQAFVWPTAVYAIVGLLMLLSSKPLGWLLARGLDE